MCIFVRYRSEMCINDRKSVGKMKNGVVQCEQYGVQSGYGNSCKSPPPPSRTLNTILEYLLIRINVMIPKGDILTDI